MRIGIDYIAAVGGGGNSVYTISLVSALIDSNPSDQFYLYVYIHDFLQGRFGELKQPNIHIRPIYASSLGLSIPRGIISLWNSISVKAWAKVNRLDVFHVTNPLNFTGGIKNTVVTIHDLSNFHNRSWTKIGSHSFLEKNMRLIIEKASRLIAVSEYTKKDLVEMFHVPAEKIAVIHEAADPKIFYPDPDTSYISEKFGVTSYILYAGQLQPRKNILNILRAYGSLSPEIRLQYKLVLVGVARDQEYFNTIRETIKQLDIDFGIKIIGRVTNNDLRKLYSTAHVFLFPSLFEGFGLPVLEALQCGTPAITSNTTSLPEVVGGAGVTVDPASVEKIQEALTRMLSDRNYYEATKSKTLPQAQKFSWDKAAHLTLQTYGS